VAQVSASHPHQDGRRQREGAQADQLRRGQGPEAAAVGVCAEDLDQGTQCAVAHREGQEGLSAERATLPDEHRQPEQNEAGQGFVELRGMHRERLGGSRVQQAVRDLVPESRRQRREPDRPWSVPHLAEVAARQQAADAGEKDATSQRGRHAVRPREERQPVAPAEQRCGSQSSQETPVGHQSAPPYLEDIEKVGEPLGIGGHVEEPRASQRPGDGPGDRARQPLGIQAVPFRQQEREAPADRKREQQHAPVAVERQPEEMEQDGPHRASEARRAAVRYTLAG
jgi:hypothetical protein